jgi:hypothetical protein
MQRIEFTNEELELLREMLQKQDEEIGVEILRTDTFGFKELLKHRRVVLENILNKIASTVQPA